MNSDKTLSKPSVGQLFLCHSHDDKRFVRRLTQDYRELSVGVWLDEWELGPGDWLHGCIGAALESVAYMGVVMSPSSLRSRWCRSELQQSLAREKRTGEKVVIPLLYRKVTPPAFSRIASMPTSVVPTSSPLHKWRHSSTSFRSANWPPILQSGGQRCIGDVEAVLNAIGWKGVTNIGTADWHQLRAILAKHGITIGDRIDISKMQKTRARSMDTSPTSTCVALPNIGLQLTAYSVRSFVAPAFGSS